MQNNESKYLKISTCSIFVYDFDGVMTDNKVYVDQNGKESVCLNRSDGLAISKLRNMNIEQLILSTETNPVVTARAQKLKLPVIQGADSKVQSLSSYLDSMGKDWTDVLYIGNDINDLEVMSKVKVKIAPADAYNEILDIADFVLNTRGGQGVIRELYSIIISQR